MTDKIILTDKWSYRGLRTVILGNSELRFIFLPDLGGILWKIQRKKDDLNILYSYKDPSLYGKMISSYFNRDPIHHFFIGGWFEAFPNAGFAYSDEAGQAFDLHGETPYSPWDYEISDNSITMAVDISAVPLRLKKKITLSNKHLQMDYEITNFGEVDLPFSWLQHPCLDLTLFDNSTIELEAESLTVDDNFRSNFRKFKYGYRGEWPNVMKQNGEMVNLSNINYVHNENFVETVYIKVSKGYYRIINLKNHIELTIKFNEKIFPYIWYWIANGGGGYPWYGTAKVFSLEISTSIPATGLRDQIKNGTARYIPSGSRITTQFYVTIASL